MSDFQAVKRLVRDYYEAMDAAKPEETEAVLRRFVSEDYDWKASHPFRDLAGIEQVAGEFWAPLKRSLRGMQRFQDVFMAGKNELGELRKDPEDAQWVMSMGYFVGVFEEDFLGIRCTHKMNLLRYSEFTCVSGGKIVKTGMFFDLIGFMIQAGANPLPPQEGAIFIYPGPREHNGLLYEDADEATSRATSELVLRMCEDIGTTYDTMTGLPIDTLAENWAEDTAWYGTAGACFTLDGFRKSLDSFSEQLKDKGFVGHLCRFAEGDFYCFFGWPNLVNTPIGGAYGYTGGQITAEMQVVDVYCCKDGKVRENWVFIDLPYWLLQQGLDILDRNRKIATPL